MTVEQKQCLLRYLGYEFGPIDGIKGKKTQAAINQFKAEYGVEDEEYGLIKAVSGEIVKLESQAPTVEITGTFWDEIEFFTREEFRCTCPRCGGFPVEPDELMVRVVNEIRRRAGVPISIVDAGGSGIRCQAHNDEIPGAAKNSYHVKGMAADLHSKLRPSELYKIAEQVLAEMVPGRGGLGLYSWGIHVDVGKYSRWNG